MSWVGAAIGAGAALLGGERANQANADATREMVAFQREMSNSAHQREVRDLQKAGLNPILSANAGASTPQGAAAKMENTLAPAVTSAMDATRLKKDMELAGTQNTLNAAQALATAQTARREGANAKQIETQTKLLEATMPNTIKESQSKGAQAAEYLENKNYYNIMERVNKALPVTNTAIDAMKFPFRIPGLGKSGKQSEKWPNAAEQAEALRQKQKQDAEAIFNRKY